MTEDNDPCIDTFVGSYFHSDGKDGGWQGTVLEALGDKGTYYYVQTFNWLHGGLATRHVVSIHDMRDWVFYSCAENMRANYPAMKIKWDRITKRRGLISEFVQDAEKVLANEEVTAESLFTAYKRWVEL